MPFDQNTFVSRRASIVLLRMVGRIALRRSLLTQFLSGTSLDCRWRLFVHQPHP